MRRDPDLQKCHFAILEFGSKVRGRTITFQIPKRIWNMTRFLTLVSMSLFTLSIGAGAGASTINETQLRLLPDDAAFMDQIGFASAISGHLAVVGSRFDDDGGLDSGSSYVFDARTGTQLAKLTADDAAAGDQFGSTVAISGETVLVGGFSDAAYLFDATTGEQLHRLVGEDTRFGDAFGSSVAISGNTAIVGAFGDDNEGGHRAGSAYLFDVETGAQITRLSADDVTRGDNFARSVAISGNTVIVGSVGDDDAGETSGSAYLFDATTGAQLAKLTASDGAAGDRFGNAVAISGNIAVVGAFADNDFGVNSGAAYLFDVTTGEQIARLTAPDPTGDDVFGDTVAIFGNTVVIGSSRDDFGSVANIGSVHVFDATTGERLEFLFERDGSAGDLFGDSVGISDEFIIAGLTGDIENGVRSGSAIVFQTDGLIAPVPLPAAGWMLLLACGALSWATLRGKSK